MGVSTEGGRRKPKSEQRRATVRNGGRTGRTQATTGQLTDGSRISVEPRMQVVGSSSQRGGVWERAATSLRRGTSAVQWDWRLGWYGFLAGEKVRDGESENARGREGRRGAGCRQVANERAGTPSWR